MLRIHTPDGHLVNSSRELSQPMGLLVYSLPHLFARENLEDGGLCENGAINIIGALLASVYQEQLIPPLEELGFDILSNVKPSYSVLNNRPIILSRENQIGTGNVLVAHAYDSTVLATVISGDFTGLIGWNYPLGFKPVRIFHDRSLKDHSKYRPYNPNIVDRTELSGSPIIKQQATERFRECYYEYVNTVKRDKNTSDIYMSDVFIYLCRQLQIPLDEERFHFVRDIKLKEAMMYRLGFKR